MKCIVQKLARRETEACHTRSYLVRAKHSLRDNRVHASFCVVTHTSTLLFHARAHIYTHTQVNIYIITYIYMYVHSCIHHCEITLLSIIKTILPIRHWIICAVDKPSLRHHFWRDVSRLDSENKKRFSFWPTFRHLARDLNPLPPESKSERYRYSSLLGKAVMIIQF